jgi:hypothetical protein
MRSREEFEGELWKQKRCKNLTDHGRSQLVELQYRLRILELEEKNRKLNEEVVATKQLNQMMKKAFSLS